MRNIANANALKTRKFDRIAVTFDEYQALSDAREVELDEAAERHRVGLCKSTVAMYVDWVKQAVLLMFRVTKGDQVKFSVKRAAKRGDKQYRKQVKDRMDPVFKAASNLPLFFNRKSRKVNGHTNALYVTGTIPMDRDLEGAWRRKMPYHFNLFMTRLRREYGRCWIVWRTWEAHKSGYPHFHAVLFFPDREFTCFRLNNKWRVHDRTLIRSFWGSKYNHSSKVFEGLLDGGAMYNMDIQAMDSLDGGLKYIGKYITKATKFNDSSDSKSVLTLALMWRFKKRAYSTSRGFTEYANALLSGMDNSTGSMDPCALFGAFWASCEFYLCELIGFYYGEGNAEWFCGWLPDRLKVPLYLDPRYSPRVEVKDGVNYDANYV